LLIFTEIWQQCLSLCLAVKIVRLDVSTYLVQHITSTTFADLFLDDSMQERRKQSRRNLRISISHFNSAGPFKSISTDMAEGNEVGDIADDALKYDTYEQYLDSQISQLDLYYLEDQDLARQLVELGDVQIVCITFC
jgi:hypothetical protein